MLRLSLIVGGLVSLTLGMLQTAPHAAAQEQIALKVLAEQRVELLPQEPLCWNVFRMDLAPGFRGASHAHALTLGYGLGGSQLLEFLGGPTGTVGPGEGNFIGQNNWHIHANPGTTTHSAVVFHLTCDDQQLLLPPTSTRLGKTDVLPGIRPAVPYVVRLIEGAGAPGAQYPVHAHAGPETVYVHEGALAVTTETGTIRLNAGQMGVLPPGLAHQPTAVGTMPLRFLVAALTPVPEPHLRLLPDVRFPSLGPAALPRTGEATPWIGPLAVIAGVVMLAAGIGLRRAWA